MRSSSRASLRRRQPSTMAGSARWRNRGRHRASARPDPPRRTAGAGRRGIRIAPPGDAIDRAHAAARHPLLGDSRDQPVLLELPDGVVEGTDVDAHVAFDHRRLEPASDLVGMKVAPVQHAENEEPCIHSLIRLI
jgi:hypothetical protein